MLVLSLILACAGPEEELPDLSLDDIREQYRIVDSLNVLVFSNELDTSDVDRYVVLGRDIRNGGIVIRRGEKRMVGCIMFRTLFGLFYEDCDSSACNGIGGIKVIDYQGYAGVPYYVGCAPDTSS
ncbi:MAG: hypothetical protein JSU61_10290 [Fidelibacterota bacterium]|nr:MAG: hypothetical protein JSU61_10290 [Candidatus Neomarinimicrobiota bacterium]